jgi:hypothetical protein
MVGSRSPYQATNQPTIQSRAPAPRGVSSAPAAPAPAYLDPSNQLNPSSAPPQRHPKYASYPKLWSYTCRCAFTFGYSTLWLEPALQLAVMPRKKGKTKGKGSAKSTPQRAPKRQSSQSWPLSQDGTFARRPSHRPNEHCVLINPVTALNFSLKDEARWQSSHRTTAFESGKRLRHLPIQFVSAGHLEGTIKKHLPPAEVAESESEPESDSEVKSSVPSSPSSTLDNINAMSHMAIRSPSPAVSDAAYSSDEVVFQGRGQAPLVRVAQESTLEPTAVENATTSAPAEQPIVSPLLAISTADDHGPLAKSETQTKTKPAVIDDVGSDSDSVVEHHFAKRRGGRPAWEGTTTAWQHRSKPNVGWLPLADRPEMMGFLRGDANPRDAAMDDYMQNVEDFGLTGDVNGASSFARREMDLDAGDHNDWESESDGQREEQEDAKVAQGNDSWDSDMLRDLEDLSTSSDVMDTVVRILSKRTRRSGVHYLCVYADSVTDDARWLPATFLKSAAEQRLVYDFENDAYLHELESSDCDLSDDDDDVDNYEDDDSEIDDEELDDETIARVLQKQEELGLGSDEVLLYGGDEYFGSIANTKAFTGKYGKSNSNRTLRERGNRNANFPSASALADALSMDPYGGFDIMDTERPSLKPKKKGRRGQMPPELEDPDLNEQLQNAWEADRAKKRLKKAEREELRQQGLLGRKGKGVNMKVKYSGGIDMEDVVEEIREFMLGDRQSLSLPPMDAHRRATIHQAAKFFDLSSRSRGDGQNRFTVLSRTSRTRVYTDAEFDRALLRKGFMKRLSGPLQGKKNAGTTRNFTFRSGPRARPHVGYRDGDKVGADAPELGPENKGHALMMKMGWSKGMALGTTDNQGILQPIAHTVKINKAGLQ